MLEKLKPYLSLDILSAVATWAIVATTACYFMYVSERYETTSIVYVALLNLGFITFWLRSTSDSNHYQSQPIKVILLLIPYLCVMGIFFLVPYNYTAILVTIWCTLLPSVVSTRWAMLTAPIWSSPLWLIYQFHWHEEYAFVSAILFLMFNIFALIMMNTATKERLAKEDANRLNRELQATQKLLNQANKQAERVRIARNIHDLLGHHLTALTINLQVASRITEGEAKQKIETCHGLAKLLLSDVREAVSEIREKSELDLHDAVKALFANLPELDTQIKLAPNVNIQSVETAETILKCIQESLTNTLKHSVADLFYVVINTANKWITISITDNGKKLEKLDIGNGLLGMQERLASIGGTATFNSTELGFQTEIAIPQENK